MAINTFIPQPNGLAGDSALSQLMDVNNPNHPSNRPAYGMPTDARFTPNPAEVQQHVPPGLAGSFNDVNASKIRGAEGNDYSAYGDIGDGAGKSIGAYQFTEKSGMAQQLAKDLGFKSVNDAGFKEALGTQSGRAAQDKLYQTYTRRPQEIANKYGVKDPNVLGFLIDTNVNGGLGSVAEAALKRGGLTMDNLKGARMDRYNRLARENPAKFGKYLKGWTNRINNW